MILPKQNKTGLCSFCGFAGKLKTPIRQLTDQGFCLVYSKMD